MPSTFEENLPKSEFIGEAVYEYPVHTGSKKVSSSNSLGPRNKSTDAIFPTRRECEPVQALEVYERLVVSSTRAAARRTNHHQHN